MNRLARLVLRHPDRVLPIALVFAGVSSPSARAQQWEPLGPGVRMWHAMCYDHIRDVTVVFGGDKDTPNGIADARNTWEWNGAAWTHRPTSVLPAERIEPAMAWDPVNEACLLFGGWTRNIGGQSDTWHWDGVEWSRRAPATSPPGTDAPLLATDWARNRIVLGGTNDGVTWEWDGANWQSIPGSGSMFGSMTWDASRQRVVAFSGSDLYEWDGSSWSTIAAQNPSPSPRNGTLVFDPLRSRLVLFGGSVSGNFVNDVWEFDGSAWSQPTVTGPAPRDRTYHRSVFDEGRGKMLAFGGTGWPKPFADVWVWDGTRWEDGDGVAASAYPAIASDPRGRILALHDESIGVSRTTEWRQGRWHSLEPATAPTGTWRSKMVYDSARDRFVLFGGTSSGIYNDHAFEWDGTDWVRFQGTTPPGRNEHAMAYDAARGQTVVFGGATRTQIIDDTWVYDGSAWSEVIPTTRPGWRQRSGMAFDPISQRVILFGGRQGYQGLGDTWAWTGSDWVQLQPASSPSPRAQFAMALDHARGRIVLHGGNALNPFRELHDTWEWDGSTWVRLSVTSQTDHHTAMESDGRNLLLFADGDPNYPSADALRFVRTTPSTQTYGAGCTGTALSPVLANYGSPLTGNPAFGVTLSNVAPDAACWVGVSDGADNRVLPNGCAVLVQPWFSLHQARSSRSGVAQVHLPVPTVPDLTGLTFYLQAYVEDGRGPFPYLVFSQGLQVDIGG